jgi:hypothetical protein
MAFAPALRSQLLASLFLLVLALAAYAVRRRNTTAIP